MFNNIFCEMKGKKVIHWGGPGGNGGTVLISSWKCNFSIYFDFQVYYLDIQAITTLYAFYWFFIQFSVTAALMKSDVFSTQNLSPRQVLDLQGWDWFHFEEE